MLIQSVPERSVYRVGIVTRAPPEPPDIVGAPMSKIAFNGPYPVIRPPKKQNPSANT